MHINDVLEMAGLHDSSIPESEMGVRFGCDCGCGGDYYTEESWDRHHKDCYESKVLLLEMAKKFNIGGVLSQDE